MPSGPPPPDNLRFDAILLHSFGGPEGPDDVVPFLENVTRGRAIPRDRLVEVGAHYQLFGGVSPINAQNRALLVALRAELDQHHIDLPLRWGNRNWHPLLADVVEDMVAEGFRRVLVLATSAFGSYSGCRQYRDDLDEAAAATDGIVSFEKLRLFWNHPGFLDAVADRVVEALGTLDLEHRQRARLVFTAHSIPAAWTTTNPYVGQLRAAAALVAARVAPDLAFDLVFQSRSGAPQVAWLEPDIVDHLQNLNAAGVDTVVAIPLGFVSDHMEVVYDLDTEASAAADTLDMVFVRAATVGTHPDFVSALADLVDEALRERSPLVAVSEPGIAPCTAGCCDRPAPDDPPHPGPARSSPR